MTMRNLLIAMMILIVLAVAATVKALNTSVVAATTRPTVTVKIRYRTSTASKPTARGGSWQNALYGNGRRECWLLGRTSDRPITGGYSAAV